MKLSEIRISTTVALMKASVQSSKNKKGTINISKDIERQCEIVGQYLGNKFLLECISDAEECLDNSKKFDEIMNKFEKIGPKFTTHIIGD
tara:strand:- start:111 stop:380 length:270 start_codon:yes stop_codon:yes gene_type:complete